MSARREILLLLLWLVLAVTLGHLGTGCVHPTQFELGVGTERAHLFGGEPSGIIRVRQPISTDGNLMLEFDHHSSIPDGDDAHTVDQFGVIYQWQLPWRYQQ